MKGGLLEHGLEGLKLLAGTGERGVELRLVVGVESTEVDHRDCMLQRREILWRVLRESGDEKGGREEFGAEICGVGTSGSEVDLQGCAGEGFFVYGVEEFDGDEDLVAGFGLIEEDDGFEVVAEGYAAAVEVDDLRHGAVGVGVEGEPDARAGEVVTVEGFGYFNLSVVPDSLVGRIAAGFDDGPVAVVEIEGFAVGKVAGVVTPLLRLEVVKGRKALDDLL